MMVKSFIFQTLIIAILILLNISCEQKSPIPGHLQKGLINFTIRESDNSLLPPEGSADPRTPLWTSNNFINKTQVNDTIFIDVNTEMTIPLDYAGGYEFADDTIKLYAKQLSQTTGNPVFATLHYKIQLSGRRFKEISFKELK